MTFIMACNIFILGLLDIRLERLLLYGGDVRQPSARARSPPSRPEVDREYQRWQKRPAKTATIASDGSYIEKSVSTQSDP